MRLRRTPPRSDVRFGSKAWLQLARSAQFSTRRKNTGTTFLFQRDQGVQQLFRPIGIFWQAVCYIG